jgi:hypothetical protein
MFSDQVVMVNNFVDIIEARMRVRETARRIGMKLTDQFSISLATSSMADAIGLGTETVSIEVVIMCLSKATSAHDGLQISFIYEADHACDLTDSKFLKTRAMVDDFNAHELNDKRLEISMIKWTY